LKFYLSDNKGDILYEFPYFYGNDWPMFYDLKAISFKDVNDDGLEDILVIAEYISGVGEDGTIPIPVGSIYFQKDNNFISIPELDDKINDNQKNTTIDIMFQYARKIIPELIK